MQHSPFGRLSQKRDRSNEGTVGRALLLGGSQLTVSTTVGRSYGRKEERSCARDWLGKKGGYDVEVRERRMWG